MIPREQLGFDAALRRVHCLDSFPLISENESHIKGVEIKSLVGIENRVAFAASPLKLVLIEKVAVDFESEGKPRGVIGELEYRARDKKRKVRLIVVMRNLGERSISERSLLIEPARRDAFIRQKAVEVAG